MSSLYENMIQIPVKMGSHRFEVSASIESGMTCQELISTVIAKCRLYGGDRLAKTYAVFESSNGIERKLTSQDDLVKLASSSSFEFVVRKVTRSERLVAGRVSRHNPNVYKQLRKIKLAEEKARESESVRIQVYEDIDRDERMRGRIADNERVLREQNEKLNALDKSILKFSNQAETESDSAASSSSSCKSCTHIDKTKLRENIGVLKTLYAKLRAIQMRRIYESSSSANKSMTSVSSRALLIDSGVNSCGSSSGDDEGEYACSSASSSTSNLESLV